MTGLIVVLNRTEFFGRTKETGKFLYWFSGCYLIALIWIFVNTYKFHDVHHFILLSSFCPITWFILDLLRRYNFRGCLNLLLASMILSAIGIIVLYRLQLSSVGILSRILRSSEGLPVVYNHYLFSVGSLVMVTMLLCSGKLEHVLDWVDRKAGVWFLGISSFLFLLLPSIMVKAGISSAAGRTSSWVIGRSGQVTEFVCKLLFIFFLAKFLSKRKLDLNYFSDTRDVIRTVAILAVLIFGFFFLPVVVFQRDLGSALMCAICTICMVYVVTGRFYFLFAGVLLLVLAVAVGTLFSPHISERVLGAWLQWQNYAFRPYPGGSLRWPGYQLFSALSSVKGADLLGTGLGSGLPKVTHITTDFIAAAIFEEFGIFGLIILVAAFLLFFKVLLQVDLRPDFYGLSLVGIALTVVCQAFFNLAFSLGLLPISGVPLTFVSNGGSSIMVGYLSVGIMTVLLARSQSGAHRWS